MSNPVSSNKRIAKNTLMLYFRMLLTMVIGLYSSRIILSELGISDYGLYCVVGGVVTMFTFVNGSLSAGTQRFLTFELGRGDTEKLKKVFSTAIAIHTFLAIIILFLAETIGMWFLLNKMNFVPNRVDAAIWVYQFSIAACMVNVIQVPFMSTLIAHEKLDIYAYMSIYDAVMKLVIVFLLAFAPFDKLIFYGLLILLVNISSAIIYNTYCRKHYEECRFVYDFDKDTFKRMFSFSAWDIVGSMASIGQSQGVNIVINMFCGTVVNAAYGISATVNNLVMGFVNNFLMAANPQIVKYYAQKQLNEMFSLVINTAKLASYLLLFIGIPIFIEIEFLLKLWLVEYPPYAPLFLRIILVQSWIQTLGTPTIRALHATGNIKLMNILVGLLLLLILPATYLMFRLGCPPETVLYINIIPWIIAIPIRLILLYRYCHFPVMSYIKKVLVLGVVIASICYAIPYSVYSLLSLDKLEQFLIVGMVSMISSSSIIFFVGIPKNIQTQIITTAKHYMKFSK